MTEESFSLKKWYLDAADQHGNVYIGYHVALHWQHLELHGYQHVWRTPENGTQSQGGLTKQPLPVWEDQHRLIWQPHHLTATWDSEADRIDETLYCTDEGEITWHCTQPKAKAQIQLPHLSLERLGVYRVYRNNNPPSMATPIRSPFWMPVSLREPFPCLDQVGGCYHTTAHMA